MMTQAKFEKLSQRQKRIFIAKDVLAQLRLKKYMQNRGDYIRLRDKNEAWRPITGFADGKTAINHADSKCHVCAKGALVCSYVRNFNGMATNEMIATSYRNRQLTEIFGYSFWNIIEALFEGWVFSLDGETARDASSDKFAPFVKVYNKNRRQYSIEVLMKNIVRNKGQLNYNGLVIG